MSCEWQCHSPAPADLYIDTGSAAQSLNPDSVQRGIWGDSKFQRPFSEAHLNKPVCNNTAAEDTGTIAEERDTDDSRADRELGKHTLDNRPNISKHFFSRPTPAAQTLRFYTFDSGRNRKSLKKLVWELSPALLDFTSLNDDQLWGNDSQLTSRQHFITNRGRTNALLI